jgi:hypothetical protein
MAEETANPLHYTLRLTHSALLPGNLREISGVENTQLPTPQQTTTMVSGVTESRLDEVRTYDFQAPYQVGVNGVRTIEDTVIVYVIDGITYTTDTVDGTTVYTLGLTTTKQVLGNFYFYRDERDVFIDRDPTISDLLMERRELAVFDSLLRLATVNSLDDLTDYFN